MVSKKIKKMYFKYVHIRRMLLERKAINKRKNLVNKVTLTKEQSDLIDKLWQKNYGKKISKDWHRLYTSYLGKFNEKYFPENLFTANLLDKMNPIFLRDYFSDKILTQYFFKDLDESKYKVVENHIYNVDGYFYDSDGIIEYNQALKKLKNIGEVIIKPTIGTDSGRGVALLNIKNGIDLISNESLETILKKYNCNYAIQEKIHQHKDFARFNPSSVNTIRMHSYICDGKIYTTPIAMRVGRKGSVVDNAHAGGLVIGVTDEGYLMEYGIFQNGEKFLEHPDSGEKFKGFKLPMIPEMTEFIKKYHYRIPHMGIIAWDLTVDENNRIVVIETNITCPGIWLPQYVTGQAFFGENTEKMIRLLKKKDDAK